MKKILKILAVIIVIVLLVVGVVFFTINKKPKSNFADVVNAEMLVSIIDNIYSGLTIELPMLQTQVLDTSDSETVKYMTGIDSTDNIEFVAVSEPMMSSQAYSLVLVKVKDGVNPDDIAKTMCDNIDNRKWICVTAEKVYTTSSGDIVCLVMSNEDTAKPVYEKFKELAGTIGQEYEKTEEATELPADMY